MANTIKSMNPALQWLVDLMSFFQVEVIKIPTDYRSKVIKTKDLLRDDCSGLVNSMLDFAINAALVPYYVRSDNRNLQVFLNDWLLNINYELRGKIPTGLNALSKQYYNERWKGSSNLLLRTFWGNYEGVELPTTLFFVCGEDIKVKSTVEKGRAVVLGEEKYYLRIDNKEEHDIPLPKQDNEKIYIQRPYEQWGVFEPVPFIIKRGLYHNLSFLKLMSEKGETIVGKALEYLFVIKKGTKELALSNNPDFVYSMDDLQKVSDDLAKLLKDKKSSGGTPTYSTNFDTDLAHLIPDYSQAVNQAIYEPIERKIMAGLGLIDILQGLGSTRRESSINPRPFMSEVTQASDDWKSMLNDIIQDIKEANKSKHPKWMKAKTEVTSLPIKEFITDKDKAYLRSIFDRGKLSNRTLVQITTDSDYDEEVRRRKNEKARGDDKALYPQVIMNTEPKGENQLVDWKNQNQKPDVTKTENVTEDKKGPEKINYVKSHLYENFISSSWDELEYGTLHNFIIKCNKCNEEDEVQIFLDNLEYSEIHNQTVSICPFCNEELLESDVEFVLSYLDGNKTIKEQSFYTKDNYPKQIKNLPSGAKSIWVNVFNAVLKDTDNEDQARQAAWHDVKLKYFKDKDGKWKKRKMGSLEQFSYNLSEILQNKLKTIPESGMGYHIVDFVFDDNKIIEGIKVLNSSTALFLEEVDISKVKDISFKTTKDRE